MSILRENQQSLPSFADFAVVVPVGGKLERGELDRRRKLERLDDPIGGFADCTDVFFEGLLFQPTSASRRGRS